VRLFFCLILLAADNFAAATTFKLGVNYSEWLPFSSNSVPAPQLATDPSGAVYLLSGTVQTNATVSTVTKLTPDGKTIVWQNQIGFGATAIAVDSTGGVYVVRTRLQSDTTGYIAKLSSTGTGLAWQISVGFLPQSPISVAADSQGRVYFAAALSVTDSTANVGRVNTAGNALDFTTQINGNSDSIAVDPSGAAYVGGTGVNAGGTTIGFLAQIASDGSPGYYTVFPANLIPETVAVDGNGNVVLFGYGFVERVDSSGAVTLTTPLPASNTFALDAAGNAYVAAATNQLYHTINSVATCAYDPASTLSSYSELLQVIDPAGNTLQATYLPGGDHLGPMALAVTPNGTVLTAATAGPSFTPTQTGPFPAGTTGGFFLLNLSPATANSPAPTVSLTCAGSSASLMLGPISPGELVSLFGSGLGPKQGVLVGDNPPNPYPTQASNVQVTFNGIPAPLLWVQDAQINAVVPWSTTVGQNTQICATHNNVTTNCLTLPVVAATPAVFTVDGVYAAALNQDGSYNTADNPAAPGTIVSVWATGLGPITPAQPDGTPIGLPLPTNNLAFGIEAIYALGPSGVVTEYVPFIEQYAGPAPTLVAGVSQINFRVESFVSYGTISLYMGSTFSPGFSIHIAGQSGP
jgi:uncharacterized protein (TIGR03437 family)